MKTRFSKYLHATAGIAFLAAFMVTEALAHGGGNWNDFRINRLDDDVKVRLAEAQQQVSDLIRGHSKVPSWPSTELERTRDDLVEIKELVDEVLEHYQSEGINLRSPEDLRATPLSGRSFAASQALEACIRLIDRAAMSDSRDAFVKDVYGSGPAAYLYELVSAHRDRMALYAALNGSAKQEEGVADARASK